jgi:hypothetical protein
MVGDVFVPHNKTAEVLNPTIWITRSCIVKDGGARLGRLASRGGMDSSRVKGQLTQWSGGWEGHYPPRDREAIFKATAANPTMIRSN